MIWPLRAAFWLTSEAGRRQGKLPLKKMTIKAFVNKISELASAARKWRVCELAAVHFTRPLTRQIELLLKMIVRQSGEIIGKARASKNDSSQRSQAIDFIET